MFGLTVALDDPPDWGGAALLYSTVVGYGIDFLGNREAFIANISAVPIPPAVWLFGSALGLMGWMRRKISS